MNRLSRLIIAALTLIPLLAFGQAKVGTTGLNFLKVGVGARAVGMGEAFTAVANDVSAVYYNPAGLIQLKMPEAAFTLVQYPADVKFVYLAGALPLLAMRGVVGAHVTSVFADEMVETTPSMPYGTGRNFTYSDLAAGITYTQRLTQNFSVGVGLKLLNEQIADAAATGWSADVGTFYTTGWKKLNIGMVIQNFGADMKFEKAEFPLPIKFRFGASITAWETDMYKVLCAGEFVHPNDNLEVYHFGAEFTYMKMFSIRIGKMFNGYKRSSWEKYVANRQDNDPFLEYPLYDEDGRLSLDGASLGLGVNIPQAGVNIDYALAGIGTLGSVHRFTISYKLAGLF